VVACVELKAFFPPLVTEKGIECSIKEQRRTTAAEVEERQVSSGNILLIVHEQRLKEPTSPYDVLVVAQPPPGLDQLPIVRSNEEHIRTIWFKDAAAELLKHLLFVRLPNGVPLRSPFAQVFNDMNRYGAPSRTCEGRFHVGLSQCGGSPRKLLPDFAAQVRLSVAGIAGQDHGNRIAIGVEKREHVLVQRMFEAYRAHVSAPGRTLDVLVVHVVITWNRTVLANELYPAH